MSILFHPGKPFLPPYPTKRKELFEDCMTVQREVNVLRDCETFLYSFRLAAKIMMDVMTEGKIKEI